MDSAFGIIKNWHVKLFSIVSPYSFYFSIELNLNEVKKDCTKGLVSDFVFIRKTQVHLEWSSTIVRKYLCPSTVGVYRGP